MYGILSFIRKCRVALIALGCLACFGAGLGVAALCDKPEQAAAPPSDPIWAVPVGEDLRYTVDGEGRIVITCEVHNTLEKPISLSDVYIAGDPSVLSIQIEQTMIPAGGSGEVLVTASLDDKCQNRTVKHDASIDMVFHWERGSALINLPLFFRTKPIR